MSLARDSVRSHAAEERLRREIAYYRARMADMRNAPEHSRHREGLVWASTQLKTLERQLDELLRSQPPANHH